MSINVSKYRYVVTDVEDKFEAALSSLCAYCRVPTEDNIQQITDTLEVVFDSSDLLIAEAICGHWMGGTFAGRVYVTQASNVYFADIVEGE